jgi:excisionase family DNA binding protein
VSKATILAWTLKRTIPFIKLGRSVRFSEPAIEEWIARNSRPPVE